MFIPSELADDQGSTQATQMTASDTAPHLTSYQATWHGILRSPKKFLISPPLIFPTT